MPFYQPQASISHPVNFYEQLSHWGTGGCLPLGQPNLSPQGSVYSEAKADPAF